MSFLKVENIIKNFGDTTVLKGIDFEVNKGEVVAIIGSSGSGKTTLLRCLNLLERPQQGKISIGDNVIFDASAETAKESDIRKKRLHFGLVFQSFNLFPQYTVKKNIELATLLQSKERVKALKVELKANKTEKAAKKTQIAEFNASERERIDNIASRLLAKVGLSEKAESYPCELSGGQQQRVAIARALALSPDILCFDEPTSALDPELTGEVLKVIKGLKSGDTTMIVVTHEMDFARNVADKIIFMARGVIEEEASAKEFFANPKSDIARQFISKSTEDFE